jgi:acetyl esterase/lipase
MKYLLLLGIICISLNSFAQEKIYLWPDGAPMAKSKEDADQPYMMAYYPATKNAQKSAVVICPGGGYGHLADDHEGKQVAKWYNDRGVTAYVLYYRLGFHKSGYTHPVPLMDAERALRTVRANAGKWGLDPNKVGIMGFSAGGHLASSLGTHFTDGDKSSKDPIEKVSSRPNYMVLGYPVINMDDSFTHRGSMFNLLGDSPNKVEQTLMSNEKQVTNLTPPTFLVHTTEDSAVPVENSLYFYLALKKAGVPAEMHIYEKGAHGLGMVNTKNEIFNSWADRLADWLKVHQVID